MIHKHLPTFQAPRARLNEAIWKLGLPRANLQLSPATTPESSSTTLGCGFNPLENLEKYSSKTGQCKNDWKHHNFILSLRFEQLLCIVVDICSKTSFSCSASRTRLSVWSAYHLLPQNQLSSLASFFDNKKTKRNWRDSCEVRNKKNKSAETNKMNPWK